ncbi:hypothetical protein Mlute_00901 [Meiothermus luteus]|uniref:Uncharacterized protein n=1 Tax=Meiothermus luteus TaxID=2026184 RepID=A0A399EYH9_9DEIN|nr:DUF5522 domain-containing protein [Meiothermus luteus]RIH87592.1 hypothetical protein Mlute_00901 [Meiothermus luteus]RMH58003.1 MAG: hypothetical protein D6684_01885 [Deinococcota bacterium]
MELREGEDYYLEGGFLVFTAAYHRKRGYCCGSGCRHCPYPKAVQAEAMRLRQEGRPIRSRAEFEARFGQV